jgi:hypothetical protein
VLPSFIPGIGFLANGSRRVANGTKDEANYRAIVPLCVNGPLWSVPP